ncbi:hypothetical protein KXD93_03425 [Mucilaginibacter sp. BJC16-A38]|uniref:hypothetical protein n=1 Tax=Mucilaginibacter phenanthrenivorans TaxID=1234842 RepID=UPI00215845CF|nr:hypothetical protein [Mucilaginibacter phenanthrenivorans]MCR8556673.1 hypothetical protein [Mucilaginibacter phenanthrenivorans]
MGRRTIYIILLILALAFTLYEELHLRKYLFAHHNYLLAGSLPNFLAAVIMSFAYMIIKNPLQNNLIIKGITGLVSGLILYEFVQPLMPHMVFDINDILASILGGLVSYVIIYFINQSIPRAAN